MAKKGLVNLTSRPIAVIKRGKQVVVPPTLYCHAQVQKYDACSKVNYGEPCHLDHCRSCKSSSSMKPKFRRA